MLLWGSVSAMDDGRQGLVGTPPFGLGANGLNPHLNQGNGFVLEFMATLVLCMTVVMTAVHKKSLAQGIPHVAPMAIGFAVFLAHIVLVPLTGCGINPARTFGPALMNSIAGSKVWDDSYWIYFVGPFCASMAAAAFYKMIFAEDAADENDEEATEKNLDDPLKQIMDTKEIPSGGTSSDDNA